MICVAVPASKRAANNKWDAANMATLGTKLKREDADRVRAAAADAGQSVNAYIWQAIRERMERDNNSKQAGDE